MSTELPGQVDDGSVKWTAATVAAALRGGAAQAFGLPVKALASPTEGHRFNVTMPNGQEFWVSVEQVIKG